VAVLFYIDRRDPGNECNSEYPQSRLVSMGMIYGTGSGGGKYAIVLEEVK